VQFAFRVLPVQGGALRHGLLLLLCGVLQVQLLGDRDVLPVPPLPVPGLVPPGSSSAERVGSNAKSTLISDRPAEPGRSYFR